jgi:hypothetical protein
MTCPVDLFDEDGEFVAAQARDHAGVAEHFATMRRPTSTSISSPTAWPTVVDQLEPVQVEEQHRERAHLRANARAG